MCVCSLSISYTKTSYFPTCYSPIGLINLRDCVLCEVGTESCVCECVSMCVCVCVCVCMQLSQRNRSKASHNQTTKSIKHNVIQHKQIKVTPPQNILFPMPPTAPSVPEPPYYRGFAHSDTRHSVGVLWTSDQPKAETST